MPGLRITSWNVDSVRLRLAGLGRLVREVDPDVLCLQETNVRNERFPVLGLRALGFPHHALHGQAGYHGVAILSKVPLEDPTPSRPRLGDPDPGAAARGYGDPARRARLAAALGPRPGDRTAGAGGAGVWPPGGGRGATNRRNSYCS